MRKKVQFKALSTFTFFVGVLFGFFPEALSQLPEVRSNGGVAGSPSTQGQRPKPSNGVFIGISSTQSQRGRPSAKGENPPPTTRVTENAVYTFGEVNGVPYYTEISTVPIGAKGKGTSRVPKRDPRMFNIPFFPPFMPQFPPILLPPQFFAQKPKTLPYSRNPNSSSSKRKPSTEKPSPPSKKDALRYRTEDDLESDENEHQRIFEEVLPRLLRIPKFLKNKTDNDKTTGPSEIQKVLPFSSSGKDQSSNATDKSKKANSQDTSEKSSKNKQENEPIVKETHPDELLNSEDAHLPDSPDSSFTSEDTHFVPCNSPSCSENVGPSLQYPTFPEDQEVPSYPEEQDVSSYPEEHEVPSYPEEVAASPHYPALSSYPEGASSFPQYAPSLFSGIRPPSLSSLQTLGQNLLSPFSPGQSLFSSGQGGPFSLGQGGLFSLGQEDSFSSGQGGPFSSGQGGPFSSGQGDPSSSGQGGIFSSGQGGPFSLGQGDSSSSGQRGPSSSGQGGPSSSRQRGPSSSGQRRPSSSGQRGPPSSRQRRPSSLLPKGLSLLPKGLSLLPQGLSLLPQGLSLLPQGLSLLQEDVLPLFSSPKGSPGNYPKEPTPSPLPPSQKPYLPTPSNTESDVPDSQFFRVPTYIRGKEGSAVDLGFFVLVHKNHGRNDENRRGLAEKERSWPWNKGVPHAEKERSWPWDKGIPLAEKERSRPLSKRGYSLDDGFGKGKLRRSLSILRRLFS